MHSQVVENSTRLRGSGTVVQHAHVPFAPAIRALRIDSDPAPPAATRPVGRIAPVPALRRAAQAAVAGLVLTCIGCAQMPSLPGLGGALPATTASLAPATSTAADVAQPPAAFDGIRKRLAVVRLENKTRTPMPDASWQLGEGLTEMLTTELFRTGRFVMVERAALVDVAKEQELGQTGLVTRESGARAGELLGAQVLVTGAITEFEESAKGGSAGINLGGFAIGLRGTTSHVAVDLRLVDVTTGQILKSFSAVGTAEQMGLALSSTRTRVPFGSDAFSRTPLGKATREAIAKAVAFVVGEVEAQQWTGQVVQARGNEIFVNAGANANLRPGAQFAVYSRGEDLRDPSTGMALGSRDTRIGTLTLREVQDKFSVGVYEGRGSVRRGDLLRTP